MGQTEAPVQPILGLVVVCCVLSALVGAMFTSAVWVQKADDRAADAIAQVCPTTTLPMTTTSAPPVTPSTAAPVEDGPEVGQTPVRPVEPRSGAVPATTTAPPPPTTEAPAGTRQNPIGGEAEPTTTIQAED